MVNQPAKLSISVPTLIGSLLSCIASFVALSLHVLVPPKRRHFRHTLIVNLLVADFINTLNNSISGILVLKNGYDDPDVPPSAQCLANAWVGQFSVQAIDFNILVISISVLMVVLRQQIVVDSSPRTAILVCIIPWIPGTITSFVGLGLGAYGPVSGNWCWVKPQLLGMRYGLTHGWRIAIFVITVGIYTFIYIKLRRIFSTLKVDLYSSAVGRDTLNNHTEIEAGGQSDTQRIWVTTTVAASYELEERSNTKADVVHTTRSDGKMQWSSSATPRNPPTKPADDPFTTSTQPSSNIEPLEPRSTSPNLRRMLLLNGYPIAYIILWIPGMANRLTESIGTSPPWLTSLQASTQFVGLANALTYGFTEQMRRTLQLWMKRRNFRTIDT